MELLQKTELFSEMFRIQMPVRRPDNLHVIGIRAQKNRFPVQKISVAGDFEFPEAETPGTAVAEAPGRIFPFHIHVVQVRTFRRPELAGRIVQIQTGLPGGFCFPDDFAICGVPQSKTESSVRDLSAGMESDPELLPARPGLNFRFPDTPGRFRFKINRPHQPSFGGVRRTRGVDPDQDFVLLVEPDQTGEVDSNALNRIRGAGHDRFPVEPDFSAFVNPLQTQENLFPAKGGRQVDSAPVPGMMDFGRDSFPVPELQCASIVCPNEVGDVSALPVPGNKKMFPTLRIRRNRFI